MKNIISSIKMIKHKRPKMKYYKYNIGDIVFYGNDKVEVVGIKASKKMNCDTETSYCIISNDNSWIYVYESELSKNRITNFIKYCFSIFRN